MSDTLKINIGCRYAEAVNDRSRLELLVNWYIDLGPASLEFAQIRVKLSKTTSALHVLNVDLLGFANGEPLHSLGEIVDSPARVIEGVHKYHGECIHDALVRVSKEVSDEVINTKLFLELSKEISSMVFPPKGYGDILKYLGLESAMPKVLS